MATSSSFSMRWPWSASSCSSSKCNSPRQVLRPRSVNGCYLRGQKLASAVPFDPDGDASLIRRPFLQRWTAPDNVLRCSVCRFVDDAIRQLDLCRALTFLNRPSIFVGATRHNFDAVFPQRSRPNRLGRRPQLPRRPSQTTKVFASSGPL